MKLFIRTDASIQIGSGHVMRCLTLADELRKRRAEVSFICRELPGNLCDFIAAKGYTVQRLPVTAQRFTESDSKYSYWLGADWQVDAEQTAVLLVQSRVDWLIVDHYARYPGERLLKWYSKTLADCNRSLLIGEVDGTPVGVLRYDVDGTQATISAYLVPGMQGRGFGSALIEAGTHWVRLHLPSVKTIVARVSSANLASISTFQKAGYHQEFCVFKKYLE